MPDEFNCQITLQKKDLEWLEYDLENVSSKSLQLVAQRLGELLLSCADPDLFTLIERAADDCGLSQTSRLKDCDLYN
jgi:hypothetical protein